MSYLNVLSLSQFYDVILCRCMHVHTHTHRTPYTFTALLPKSLLPTAPVHPCPSHHGPLPLGCHLRQADTNPGMSPPCVKGLATTSLTASQMNQLLQPHHSH